MAGLEGDVRRQLQQQLEYYFSDENLVKDDFLRNHMDEAGFVDVSLIAGFRKVTVRREAKQEKENKKERNKEGKKKEKR